MLSRRQSSGYCPSRSLPAPATASTGRGCGQGREWGRAWGHLPRGPMTTRMTRAPNTTRLQAAGMSYHHPTPPSTRSTTRSLRSRASRAISQPRTRARSPLCASATAAREGRCLHSRLSPSHRPPPPPPLPMTMVMRLWTTPPAWTTTMTTMCRHAT